MPVQKNIQQNTFAARMNSDAADELLQPGEYREAYNLRSKSGIATNVKGNTHIPYTFPGTETAEVKTIGRYVDAPNNRLIYFVYHSEGLHHILEYDLEQEIIIPIFISKTNSDDVDILKFDKDYLITGVEIVNGTDLLIWCDNLNPVRCLNISEARERVGWKEDQINLYKEAPPMPPDLFYFNDTSRVNNYLHGNLIKAAYRYIYKDGLISTFSDYSKVPLPVNENYRGENSISSNNNGVKIRIGTGDETVEKIEIAVQVGDREFVSVKILDKEQEEILDNSTYDFLFYNDGNYSVLPKDDLIQPYNFLPKTPAALALINGKILAVAGGEEGWDDVAITAESDVEYEEIDMSGTTSTVVDTPSFTTVTGLSYFQRPAPPYRSTQTFIVGANVSEGYQYFVRGAYHWDYTATSIDTAGSIASRFRNAYLQANKYGTATNVTLDDDGNASFTGIWRSRSGYKDFSSGANGTTTTVTITGSNKTIKANKSGAVVQYGIQYEDAEGRKSPTFTSDDLIVKSDFINTHTQVGNPKIKVPVHVLQISHTPPAGAVRFQLMRSRNLTYKKFVQALTHAAYEVINDDTGELYLDLVIDGFDAYNKLYPNSIISYQFNPGDRVRFIRGKTNQTTNVAYGFHEAVILEQRWNAVQTIDGNVTTAASTTQITVDTGQTNEAHVGKKIRLSKEGGITIERTITGVADTSKYNIDQAIGFTDTYATYELIDIRQVIRIKKPLFDVSDKSMIEIFTPALGETSDGSKIFFEFGQKYEIVNPGADTRAHVGSHQDQTNTLPAIFKIKEGDIYIRNREVPTNLTLLPENIQTYVEVVEDENFSDFYVSDLNDNGRPSTVFTDTEAKQFGSRIRFGQQNLTHTDTNRINLFRSNDREDYEDNYGDIRLLKFKEERLLCFKEKMFGYIPVLQNIVRTADGNSLLSASSKLLNPIQYFTFNGGIGDAVDSFTEGENQWYASCPEAGTWLRFGGDGFTPISQTSMFDVASKSHFEHVRLNGAKVHAGYDRKNQEAIFAIENTPPKVFDNVFNPNSWVVSTPTSVDLTSFEIVTQPTKGTLSLGEGGAATYSATPGQTGTDFFTFKVNDTSGIGYPITKVCIDVVEAVSFNFIDQSGLEPSTLIESNVTTVTGIYDDYIINVDPGAEYRVNGGTWLSGSEASILKNGDTVQLRETTSDQYGVGVGVPVTIAGVTKTWTITVKPPLLAWRAKDSTGYCITREADITPDPFAFTDVNNAEINTQYTSNAITVAGIEAAAPISVSGGEYEINTSGTWLTAASEVNNGDTVKVRRTSSGSYLAAVGVTLNINGVTDEYLITTRAADSSPGVFVFQDKTNADLNTYYNSNTVTITGIDPGTAVSVTGGEYSINGGNWTSTAGTINASQTVAVRGLSSSSYTTAVNVTLTVGTYSDTYTITTKAASVPVAFTFVDQTGVDINTYAVSNSVSISGLASPATIALDKGGNYSVEYSINGGAWSNDSGDEVAEAPPTQPTPTTTLHLIGYGAQGSGITGGSSATTPVTVTTYTALRSALQSTSPQIIKVSGTITMTNYISLQSNKTVIGLDGATITGGGFYIDGKSNIIIQNLIFRNIGFSDGITIRDSSHHIWVDHCDFADDDYDGLLDITNASDFVTVSWCKFTGASKCVLIGSTYPATNDVGKLNVTLHHNWFLNNFERQPSIRYGKIHFFNNLVEKNSSATMSFSYGVGAREECHVRAEYNAFIGITEGRPLDDLRTNGKFAGISTNYYDATSNGRNRVSNQDESYTPPYTYTYDRAQDVPSLVRSGAGATLGNNATGATSTTTTPIPTTPTSPTTSTGIIGYGASTTGGAAGSTVSVSTFAQLKQEAESSGAKIIKVSGTLTGDGTTSSISVASDKSILGLYGATISGIRFNCATKNNIIIRNLILKDHTSGGGLDAILLTNTTNVWIDHCTFTSTLGEHAIDAYDGTDLVTISNCKFDKGVNTVRLGNTSGDAGKMRVTFVKNHVLNCQRRAPLVQYGHVHILNNFFQYNGEVAVQTHCIIANVQATLKIENNYFHGIPTSRLIIDPTATGYQETGSVNVSVTGTDTIASGKAITVTMPYSYTAQTAQEAQAAIIATNGAGATLSDPTATTGTASSVTVTNGDTIRLRILTTGTYNAAHSGTLTVNSSPAISDTFDVQTMLEDRMPADFSFTNLADKEINTLYESNAVTITGITNNTEIIPSAGMEYKVGSGNWIAGPTRSTINNNETLTLRQTSSSSYGVTKTVSITVGEMTRSWWVHTRTFNQTPQPWCFTTNLTNAEPVTLYESEVRTVTGMDSGTAISSNVEFRINGGAWITGTTTINPNSTVQIRRYSGDYSETVSGTLTIGTTSCTWTLTSRALVLTVPNDYSWTAVTNAELNTTYVSNAIVVSGINTAVAISVTGGEYSINSSGTTGTWSAWTTAAGTVNNGQGVRVRRQSSSAYTTLVSAGTTIGGNTQYFNITTKDAPPPPPVGIAHGLTIPQSGGINEACPAPRTQTRYTYESNLVPTVSMQFYNDVNLTTAYTGSGWHGLTWGGPNNVGVKYAVNLLNGVVQSVDFCVETPPDTSPADFFFQRKDNVELNTAYISNSVQITGINAATAISISGGTYSTSPDNLSWSSFTAASGTITNGTWVRLNKTSSTSYWTEVSATLTVGDKTGVYYVKTKDAPPPPPPAGIPHQLTIPSATNDVCPQPRTQTRYTSETNLAPTVGMQFYSTSALSSIFTGTGWHGVTWGGPNNVGSKYALLLNNGLVQQVEICPDPDTEPLAYQYTPKDNAELNTLYVSDPVTITGINAPATITVTGGEYSLNSTTNFTSAQGTLTSGTQVRIRARSSGSYNSSVFPATTIGGVSASFRITTKTDPGGQSAEGIVWAHVGQSSSRALTVNLSTSAVYGEGPILVAGVDLSIPLSWNTEVGPKNQTVTVFAGTSSATTTGAAIDELITCIDQTVTSLITNGDHVMIVYDPSAEAC